MTSLVTHAVVGLGSAALFRRVVRLKRFWFLSILISIFPDLDGIGYHLGVPYESFWGHRGFSHALLFSCVLSFVITTLFFRKYWKTKIWWGLVLYFFMVASLHSILDAMTTGGLGIAFFSPFDTTRYFFPWRPIAVAPLTLHEFFSPWGWRVIKSEWLWVWLPFLGFQIMGESLYRLKKYL